jgi:glutamine amidotransferase
MCELLALHFNQNINPRFSLKGFQQRARVHSHGWGLAWFPDGEAQIIKEPRNAMNSSLFEAVYDGPWVKSKNIISHLRFATHGNHLQQNTHPFMRYYRKKSIVFAHNGVLNGHESLALKGYQPAGQTDSEHAFCHLLGAMKEQKLELDRQGHYPKIQDILKHINSLGKFNCIFSDGERLFVYHTATPGKSLHYAIRKAPFGRITLSDLDMSLNLEDEKNPHTRGVVIATAAITDNENWQALPKGQLFVFKDGVCIFGEIRTHDTPAHL